MVTSLRIGAYLFVLYGFLYVLLQLEDYALLIGSIGLFIVLGTVMYMTRRIDWFTVGSRTQTLGPNVPVPESGRRDS